MSDKEKTTLKLDDVALIVCGTILFILFIGEPDLHDIIKERLQR